MNEPASKLPDAAVGKVFIALGAVVLLIYGWGPFFVLVVGTGGRWTNDLTFMCIVDALAIAGITVGLWLQRKQ